MLASKFIPVSVALWTGCRLLSRGVFAVFGSHTVATINTLRSFSAAFRLPFVSVGLPVTDPRSHRHRRRHHDGQTAYTYDHDDDDVLNYDVYMRPRYASAIIDLLRHYDCRQVWYIYNSNEGNRDSSAQLITRSITV